MTLNTKRLLGKWLLIFALGSIIEYAAFHIFNIFRYSEAAEVLTYVRYYTESIWEFLFPALSVLPMLIIFTYGEVKHSFLAGALFSLTRALYHIPLGYITFIGYGYDSIESLLISLPFALIYAIIAYAEMLVSFGLGLFAAARISSSGRGRLREVLGTELYKHDWLDLGNVGTAAICVAVTVRFIKSLVSEIIDTVGFFVENGFTASAGEIIYILFKYVFALGMLLGSHALICFIKKRALEPNAQA